MGNYTIYTCERCDYSEKHSLSKYKKEDVKISYVVTNKGEKRYMCFTCQKIWFKVYDEMTKQFFSGRGEPPSDIARDAYMTVKAMLSKKEPR